MKSTSEQRGWYYYDWANSAFYTTAITVLLARTSARLQSARAGFDAAHPEINRWCIRWAFR